MKKINDKVFVVLLILLGFSACKTDEDIITPVDVYASAEYALITRPQNTDGSTFSAYMQKMDAPDMKGNIDNSNTYEISAAHLGGVYAANKSVYVNDYLNATITGYRLSDDNVGEMIGSTLVPELGFQGNIAFQDEETAYIGGSGSIVIFNPSTMSKTGLIDWSSMSRVGEVTDFPVPGASIQGDGVTEIIISGNYMYAALYQMYDFNTFTPATNTCSILVIDLSKVDTESSDNSDALVEVITDTRGSFTGAWNTGGGVYYMNKTANGDIYVLCHNVFGGARAIMDKPACILRIRSGATSFDSDYYFDLETASQGIGNPVTNFEFYDDGKFLATVLDPTQLDPDNPYSYNTDPVFRWWTFDLNAQTASSLGDEYTNAGKSAKCFFEDGYAYVPYTNLTENYINQINLSDLTKTKLLTTSGLPHILKLN